MAAEPDKARVLFVALISLLLLVPMFASCESPSPRVEYAMNTLCSVNLFGDGNSRLYSEIFLRIREIDRTMTAFPPILEPVAGGPVSGVVEIGRQAGIMPVHVGPDLIFVLERALYFAEISDGAFDPTIGPLTKLWGIRTQAQRVPDCAEIAAALDLVDWRDLVIDREAGTVFLRRPGMSLDLGSIAKGYAGDEAARIAREAGVRRAIIDLGGNIVLVGRRQQRGNTLQRLFSRRVHEDLPWRIGLQNPIAGRGEHIAVVYAHDTSIVTSGVYNRFFVVPAPDGNRRYHHLFSTTTGFPVENGLLSVTVITKSSTDADALSTVAFTMGYERGRAVIDSRPGVEAIFVFEDRSVRITCGLAGILRMAGDEFVLAE
ncbi:MAG: FAD:protein FMN transferase [Treponema sp.]|nr:FAD:protein FMN transferase [Treponema sp.]